jgi:hypothetical protein
MNTISFVMIHFNEGWDKDRDMTQPKIIINLKEFANILPVQLTIFSSQSSNQRATQCKPIIKHVWLRCKSAICRLNNDYVVCDTFDANRYQNL